jgi:K+-sensing histidine kinase KdpD
VIDESERLNRFIANLLDMTKLESGAIVPNSRAARCREIVGSALRRAGKILVHHKVSLQLRPDLPMLELDAVLFEQVLFNLLDNAAKYAPSGTTISIRGARDRDSVSLQIMDEGDGIRRRSSKACSINSIAPTRATMFVRAPGWGWRSRAVSSRRCTARSPPPTAPTAAEP